jgi:ABC-2 type transport system ATP-binding protein
MNAAAIEMCEVRKGFGNATVLDGVNLQVQVQVPVGSIFALVGANGAGKTTCIKSLLNFALADSGSISLFGDDHRHSTSRARLIFLPERFLPPHHLTGFEFLDYMARLHGNKPNRQRADTLLPNLILILRHCVAQRATIPKVWHKNSVWSPV